MQQSAELLYARSARSLARFDAAAADACALCVPCEFRAFLTLSPEDGMAEVFVMRDGKIAERRARMVVLEENDYR